MNYCPNCKKEYNDDKLSCCPKCNSQLKEITDSYGKYNKIMLFLVISNLIIYFCSIFIALWNEGIQVSESSPSVSGLFIIIGPIVTAYLYIFHIICLILIALNCKKQTQIKSYLILIFSILSLGSIVFSYNDRIFMLENHNILFYVSLIECIVLVVFAFFNILKYNKTNEPQKKLR